MAKTQLPMTNGFYVSRSLPTSAQECVNMYVHVNQRGGLSERSLWGTPGINQLTTTGVAQQINRGAHEKNGIPYFVNGNTLYSLDRKELSTTTLAELILGIGLFLRISPLIKTITLKFK